MLHTMLLNDKELHLSETDLPCLISYREKTGGSQFSVTLVADLFIRGSKILFLTAYPMATENFLEQIAGTDLNAFVVNSENDLKDAEEHQAVMIKSGDEELFMKAVAKLPDIQERVVFVKNIEAFSDKAIQTVLAMPKIILSGDVDQCSLKADILKIAYRTTVSFSQPGLEKYTGYLKSPARHGIVKLDQ